MYESGNLFRPRIDVYKLMGVQGLLDLCLQLRNVVEDHLGHGKVGGDVVLCIQARIRCVNVMKRILLRRCVS